MAGDVAFAQEQKTGDTASGGGSWGELMPLGRLHGMEIHSVNQQIEELLERAEMCEAHGVTPVRLDHPFATGHLKLLVA
jgi:hypothetical protein